MTVYIAKASEPQKAPPFDLVEIEQIHYGSEPLTELFVCADVTTKEDAERAHGALKKAFPDESQFEISQYEGTIHGEKRTKIIFRNVIQGTREQTIELMQKAIGEKGLFRDFDPERDAPEEIDFYGWRGKFGLAGQALIFMAGLKDFREIGPKEGMGRMFDAFVSGSSNLIASRYGTATDIDKEAMRHFRGYLQSQFGFDDQDLDNIFAIYENIDEIERHGLSGLQRADAFLQKNSATVADGMKMPSKGVSFLMELDAKRKNPDYPTGNVISQLVSFLGKVTTLGSKHFKDELQKDASNTEKPAPSPEERRAKKDEAVSKTFIERIKSKYDFGALFRFVKEKISEHGLWNGFRHIMANKGMFFSGLFEISATISRIFGSFSKDPDTGKTRVNAFQLAGTTLHQFGLMAKTLAPVGKSVADIDGMIDLTGIAIAYAENTLNNEAARSKMDDMLAYIKEYHEADRRSYTEIRRQMEQSLSIAHQLPMDHMLAGITAQEEVLAITGKRAA